LTQHQQKAQLETPSILCNNGSKLEISYPSVDFSEDEDDKVNEDSITGDVSNIKYAYCGNTWSEKFYIYDPSPNCF